MRLLKLITCLFVLFFSKVTCQIQINGLVLNETKNPIIGAHIHCNSNNTETNFEGKFSIERVKSGKIKLFISYIGYIPLDTLLVANESKNLIFQLKSNTKYLNEVLVSDTKKGNTIGSFEQKINVSTIDKYSNSNFAEALKEVSGVSLLKSGSNVVKPIIQGLHSSRIPIFTNSIRLEDQQWGAEHAPNLDINSAGKITVIKGASAMQYSGNAIGGIILVDPIDVKKDTLFGKSIINYNTNGRGGNISTSLHKGNFCDWAWNVNGNFKFMGDRNAPDYNLSNTSNTENSFSGNLKYIGKKYSIDVFASSYQAKIGILRASHIGNSNDLENSINNQIPSYIDKFSYIINSPKQEVAHYIGKLNFEYNFQKSVLQFQYAYQFNIRKEFDVRRGANANKAALDLGLTTHQIQANYKHKFEKIELKIGNSFSFQENKANPETGVRPLIPDYLQTELGTYAIATFNLNDKTIFETGIRYDFAKINATKYYFVSRWNERNYNHIFPNFEVQTVVNQILTKPNFKYNNVSANFGLRKLFDKNYTLYSSISLTSRNPNPSELFSDGLHHATGMIELGDLTLKQEKSLKATISLIKRTNNLFFEINPYVNIVSNFMYLLPKGVEKTIRGDFLVWEYLQSKAILYGIDFSSKWQINSVINYQFQVAYVRGKNKSNNLDLIDIPPFNLSQNLQFIKKEWYNFEANLKNEFVSKQNNFPNNDFVINTVQNNILVPKIVNISQTPSAYNLTHFYLSLQPNILLKTQTTFSIFVQNILNTNYRDYLNKQRFFANELGRNIQLQIKINY